MAAGICGGARDLSLGAAGAAVGMAAARALVGNFMVGCSSGLSLARVMRGIDCAALVVRPSELVDCGGPGRESCDEMMAGSNGAPDTVG